MNPKFATFDLLVKIVRLTIELRQVQKEFFENHKQNDLIRSKQLERILDTMLLGIVLPEEKPEPKQGSFLQPN